MDGLAQVRERLLPVVGAVPLDRSAIVLAVLLAAAAVAWSPLWRWLRLAVTLVHEVGHALVGIACGRRFTGFVVAGDSSGHAVTVGPARGFGRIATTWAGYPAPAVTGLVLVAGAARGYAAPMLAAAIVLGLALVVLVRSLSTLLVLLAALALVGALWWWREDGVQAQALVILGLVLLVGAWRGLGAVWRRGGRGDDPAVLRRLTGIPALVWQLTWAAVCAGATVLAAWLLLAAAA